MGTMLKQRAQLVDDIWHACGDTATDYNWYTKRGLLAAVYAATELFMITDYSPGYADTWQSLDRRLKDVKRFGSAATEVVACAYPDAWSAEPLWASPCACQRVRRLSYSAMEAYEGHLQGALVC